LLQTSILPVADVQRLVLEIAPNDHGLSITVEAFQSVITREA
jgi:hypothetical protein